MRKRGTHCIAPKLCGRTSKALNLKFHGRTLKAQKLRGILQPLMCTPRKYEAFEVCPTEFCCNATCWLRCWSKMHNFFCKAQMIHGTFWFECASFIKKFLQVLFFKTVLFKPRGEQYSRVLFFQKSWRYKSKYGIKPLLGLNIVHFNQVMKSATTLYVWLLDGKKY